MKSIAAGFILLFCLAALPCGAQTWEQASTEHFLFIYEPRDRPYVDELLGFAEDVYAKVTGFYGSYPKLVPCVLRGRIDEANGETLAFPGRIELWLTAPTDYFLGARSESWLRLLLTHEFTHFVHQTMSTGFLHDLSLVFGRELEAYSVGFLPDWAVEGPAVYDETLFSQGGRGRNPLFEMYTRAPAEDGSLFDLGQAAYLSPFPPPSRVYVAGYALVSWLESAYGAGTFSRILDEYLQFPFFGPDNAIRKVTGKEPDTIFAEMRKAMTARWAPETAIPAGELLTPERPGNWTHPQVTARGLYLYRRKPDAFPAVVRWDPASGTETVLVRAALTDAASFSATADGNVVWFASQTIDDSRQAEERSSSDILALEVPSGRVRQLTRGAHLWHPSVSPDGAALFAVQGSGPYSRLVSVDQRTGKVRALFSRAGANVYNPAVSPDGARVAFILNVRGFQDVYVADSAALQAGSVAIDDPRAPVVDVNPDLARPVLGPDQQAEYYPSFADNGTLLFSSDRSGSLSLYSANLSTGDVILRQRDPVAVIEAVSDGRTFFYSSYSSFGYCVRSVPVTSLAAEPLPSPVEPLPYPPAPPSVPSAAGRLYVDLPLPYLWLPAFSLAQAGPRPLDIAVGLGAQVFGGSFLGAAQWSADALWLIGLDQPDAGAAVLVSFGPVDLSVQGRLASGWYGLWEQNAQAGANLSWHIVNEQRLDESRAITASVGLGISGSLLSGASFTFADSLDVPGSAWFSYLDVPASLGASWQKNGSALDFNPPWAVEGQLSGVAFPAALNLTAPEGEVDLSASVNVPGGGHAVVKLGLRVSQYLGGQYSLYEDFVTVPRGFTGPRLKALPGGLLAAADYMVPLGLADTPLPFGWGFTGAGLGTHVEALADFDAPSGAFSVLPVVFAGVDLSLRLSFGTTIIPVGMGVSAALPADGSFDPTQDIGLYFFAGFDSFTGVRSGARAGGAGQAARPQAYRSGVVQSILTPIFAARPSTSASE